MGKGTASAVESPRDAKPYIAGPELGIVPVAVGRAEKLRNIEPGTAADHMTRTIAAEPRRPVGRRRGVIAMVAIAHPLPDVAGHVGKSKAVGGERADRRGLRVVPLAA